MAAVAGYRTLRLVGDVQFALDCRRTDGFIADAAADVGHHRFSQSHNVIKRLNNENNTPLYPHCIWDRAGHLNGCRAG
ncbi:hypothetical protein D3C87_2010910 [compost metagenome]